MRDHKDLYYSSRERQRDRERLRERMRDYDLRYEYRDRERELFERERDRERELERERYFKQYIYFQELLFAGSVELLLHAICPRISIFSFFFNIMQSHVKNDIRHF